MGLLSPKDLVEQVKLQIKQIILELFTWREGRYRIDEFELILRRNHSSPNE